MFNQKTCNAYRFFFVLFILAAFILPFFSTGVCFADEHVLTDNQKDIINFASACGKYALENGNYPEDSQILVKEGYLDKIPVFPEAGNKEYLYKLLGDAYIMFYPNIYAQSDMEYVVFVSGFSKTLADYFTYMKLKGLFSSCCANLKVLSSGCEIYSIDNNGKYPKDLEELVETGYFDELPECPACGEMSYICVPDNEGNYIIYCSGKHHKELIGNKDGPVFNLQTGLEIYNIKKFSGRKFDLTGCRRNLMELVTVCQEYTVKKGFYPDSFNELIKSGFLKKLPVCPLSGQNTYKFISMNENDSRGFAVGCTCEEHKKDPDFTSVISIILSETPEDFISQQKKEALISCKNNIKNIAIAIEMYGTDNNGHYPPCLESIIPRYLHKLSECPVCGKMNYVYKRIGDSDFIIYCSGGCHKDTGITGPAYSSMKGLVDNIEDAK
ncbi:MAG: hypothetical protein ABIH00_03485 [Armatimonadota bacterium]